MPTRFDEPETFSRANTILTEALKNIIAGTELEQVLDDSLKDFDGRISPGALLLLLIPLIEARWSTSKIESRAQRSIESLPANDIESMTNSVSDLLSYTRENPALLDMLRTEVSKDFADITSASLIKAFHFRYCNIPPFCGEK